MAPKKATESALAEGVEFPRDAEGGRPTMGVNKGAFAAALRPVSAEEASKLDALPDKKWRRSYQKGVVEQVRHAARSKDNALKIAQAGLEYLHQTMVFVRPAGADAEAVTLEKAMAKYTTPKFHTHEFSGQGSRVDKFTVVYKPYGTPGKLKELSGDHLHKQIDTWVRNGTIELSCGASIAKVVDNPDWFDLSDLYFVLFGASSAMGPFYKLMDLGANVVAVDLDRPEIWERLLREARGRAGKLIIPVKEKMPAGASEADIAKVAGCNLLTETPEIRTWLQDLFPSKRLICMALAYLDGAKFVKVSMAMDAILKCLIEKRGADKMAVAYLCTPTDVHLCPPAAVAAVKSNMRRAPGWQAMLAPLLGMIGMPVKKNIERPLTDIDGSPLEGLHLVDCIIPEQGPNYILAKRLQHWRAMLSRDQGCLASSNVAPSTATASVLSNVLFALGYKGMSSFKPMEITYQETSNSVMAALLIRDVRDSSSAANPKTPLRNPLCLFTENSFHGGCWRGVWKFQSVGAPALLGYVGSAFLVAPYLLLYSSYQAFGWGSILAGVCKYGWRPGLWAVKGASVTWFQNLGLMEVLHAGFGFTKSSPVMTFMQIFSRIFVAALLNENPSLISGDGRAIPTMLFCWSLADMTRYVYYAVSMLRDIGTSAKGVGVAMKMVKVKSAEEADDPIFKVPFFLVWLRYSLFVVLYPAGVASELACEYMTSTATAGLSTGYADATSWSGWVVQAVQLLTCKLKPWQYMGIVFVAYSIGLPALYGMMLGARKKQLGGEAKSGKKTQ